MKSSGRARTLLAKVLIGLVLFFNLQAAVYFILDPGGYAAGFELSGIAGEKAVQGVGILFLMWNVPYVFALLDPVRHRISLASAVIMQAIGLTGETILLLTLPDGHAVLSSSILRFIAFDGFGLTALITAWLLSRPPGANGKSISTSTRGKVEI